MFFVAPVAPSGSGNYPQNPTNLRVELRKLKFVAKNDWHNVSRVKRQGGKSNAGSKKEAALANSCWAQGQLWLGQRPHCPGPAVLHQGLCNKSALLSSSELNPMIFCQKQNKLVESTGKYGRWESGTWGINVKNKESNLCSYSEYWSGNFTLCGQSDFKKTNQNNT